MPPPLPKVLGNAQCDLWFWSFAAMFTYAKIFNWMQQNFVMVLQRTRDYATEKHFDQAVHFWNMNENCVFCLGIMKEHNYRAPIKGKAPTPHAFLNIFANLFRASEAMRDWCSIYQILTINWTIGALFENFVEPKSRGRHCLLDSNMTVKLPNQNLKLLIINRELNISAGLITQIML